MLQCEHRACKQGPKSLIFRFPQPKIITITVKSNAIIKIICKYFLTLTLFFEEEEEECELLLYNNYNSVQYFFEKRENEKKKNLYMCVTLGVLRGHMNYSKRQQLAKVMLTNMLEKGLPFDYIASEIFDRYQIGELALKRMIERKEKGLKAIQNHKRIQEFENGTS